MINQKKLNVGYGRLGAVVFLVFSAVIGLMALQPAHSKQKKKKRTKTRQAFRPVLSRFENAASPEFRNLIARLKDIKYGKPEKLGVLILGDSHQQCEDFGIGFSKYLRDSLAIPYAGRGFVFPYPLARTSHRSDMQFKTNGGWHGCRFTKESNDCPWGLSGWTAHCSQDSVEFSWKLSPGSFQKNEEIVLLSPANTANDFQIQMEDSTGNATTMTYVTRNCGFSAFTPFSCNTLRFRLKRLTPGSEFILQGLLYRPSLSGVSLGISGTNGARLDHYLQNPDFQRHLKVINPALIIVSLGTNEAFASHFSTPITQLFLNQLLTRIKSTLPDVAIVLVGPPDHCLRKGKVNPKTTLINHLYSETAENLDFVFWNQQKAMGGKGSVYAWRSKGLVTRDMIHFTSEGYLLQARLLGRALKDAM